MSYEPTTWANGDIITATKLNNIESGVQSVSSSYTPTTWATGDIITATKLNNIEQGIANAGGGSSDFSTAEVTIVGDSIDITMPLVTYDPETPVGYFLNSQGDSQFLAPNTYTTVLYKGYLLCRMSSHRVVSVSLSGGCEWVSEENKTLLITGDCTITIS